MSTNPVVKDRPPVAMRITVEVLASLLRLDPDQHTIVGATIRPFGPMRLIELSIDAPHAPDGAVEMLPAYYNNGRPDPVLLTDVTWMDINSQVIAVQQLAPRPAEVVHIAGPELQVGTRLRQCCGWCGEQLIDYDLALTASPCGEQCQANGCQPEHHRPATWPAGELVEVSGGASWIVNHEDGAELPANACAQR